MANFYGIPKVANLVTVRYLVIKINPKTLIENLIFSPFTSCSDSLCRPNALHFKIEQDRWIFKIAATAQH